MLNKNMSKKEIEDELSKKGDFVQLDYLNRFIETRPPLEIKKFCYIKISEIYEKKSMFMDAGNFLEKAAESSISFSEKIEYFIGAAEFFVRGNYLEKADYAFKKALHNANSSEKLKISSKRLEIYYKYAEETDKKGKRAHAIKLYDKLFSMNLPEEKKEEIKKILLRLHEKMGNFKEAARFRKS